jgi:hypothetical protein
MTTDRDPLAFDLTDAFLKQQTKLRAALDAGDIATHAGTKGDDTELNWLGMMRAMLPRRYGVAKAFVVDSHGARSEQIDIVIHDRHFSPLLFEIGDAHFIPAESVYAVFEVKQDLTKSNLEYAADKAHTVRCLHRTSVDVPHAGGRFDPVVPRRIIGGVLARRSGWSPALGDAFDACVRELDDRDASTLSWGVDLGCALEDGGFVVDRDHETAAMRCIETSVPEVALIFFVMRLLRQLQRFGSAPAIDYDAYFGTTPTSH